MHSRVLTRITRALWVGAAIAVIMFVFHLYLERKAGFPFVQGLEMYLLWGFINALLVFLLQTMTFGIRRETARKISLLPMRFQFIRVATIAVVWFLLLLAIGIWTHFISAGRSLLFLITVLAAYAYSAVKIWNFRR